MNVEIRPLAGDWDEVLHIATLAFGESPDPVTFAADEALFERERSLAAYDGDLAVAHTGIFSLRLRVPGAIVDTAGVSWVGVLPTHRRRGILRRLMERQLADVHEIGKEPLAALTASESGIYGRFGYGEAAQAVAVEIPRAYGRLRPVDGIDEVTLRYADPEKNLDLLRSLHQADTQDRPGSVVPDERWMRKQIDDPPADRHGASVLRCVLAERSGTPTGYALYATKGSWDAGGPHGTVSIRRVHASDAASQAALWRFLIDQDLMSTAVARHLAVDDPLLSLLVDPRRARPQVRDGLWLRLVDVDRALARRTYTTSIDMVLEVRDAVCPWNAGRHRLVGSPAGAECAPTTDPADLVLDVRDLAAAYLGRPVLHAQGRAGLVEERTPGALAAAALAFGHAPLPRLDSPF